ncbi:DUF1987 domain-containing protein [bacterium]|nr:DUF1987 domain-containing protein [bacterium]
MENLSIVQTKYTLGVNFNVENGVLEMLGSSYPEVAAEFFEPIYKWLKNFLATKNAKIVMNLKFDYLNTSSVKCILNVLQILENHKKETSQNHTINWFYKEEDEDILDTGEELAEDSILDFNLKVY